MCSLIPKLRIRILNKAIAWIWIRNKVLVRGAESGPKQNTVFEVGSGSASP